MGNEKVLEKNFHGSVMLKGDNVHVSGNQLELAIMLQACIDALLDSDATEDSIINLCAFALQKHLDESKERRLN